MKTKLCFVVLVFSFLVLISGCNLFDKNSKSASDPALIAESSLVRGVAGSVAFRIKFPGLPGSGEATGSGSILSSILAAEGASPAVTFNLSSRKFVTI